MMTQVFDNLNYKFLTTDNIEINVRAYVVGRIIDPYVATMKLKSYVTTLQALCGGAVKAVVTTTTSHDILKNSSNMDEKVKKKLGRRSEVFGLEVNDFGISSLTLPPNLVEPLAREAVSERLAEAKAIKAQGEFEASKYQNMTAEIMGKNKSSLQVQYLNF